MNQFNRFGRQWQGLPAGRGRGPRQARGHRAASTSATTTATWCRSRHAGDASGAIAGPEYTNRFNLFRAAADHRQPRARLQLGPGHGGPRGGRAGSRCRARSATTGPTSPTRRRRPAGTGGVIFALSLVFVFLILAALYESWSLPFSVLLSVPIAVFGAFARPAGAQVRPRRLRADRPRHAHRPGGQERDPDRRVRQDEDARRAVRSSTPRSRARGSACGRS